MNILSFSFRGRLSRLQYLLGIVILTGVLFGAALLVGCVAFALRGGANPKSILALSVLPIIAGGATSLWYSLSLQARRFRDIGWNPVLVIPTWMGLEVLDGLVARLNPSLGWGALHTQTAFGLLLNLGLTACLLFWPSQDVREDRDASPAIQGPSSSWTAPTTPQRLASSPQGAATLGFGRRGL